MTTEMVILIGWLTICMSVLLGFATLLVLLVFLGLTIFDKCLIYWSKIKQREKLVMRLARELRQERQDEHDKKKYGK